MKFARKVFSLLFVLSILSSCTVLNNLYVADPKPIPDDVDTDGNISFSGDLTWAPNVVIGGQYGVGEQFNLRFAMHFASIFGGAGARVGGQYSFFSKDSKFNAALGTDLGAVMALDSIKIWGELDIHTNGAWHADFFYLSPIV